ncbi:2559_t:CDS:2 [Paraglomus brasilianum]|uniref:2559_t:CDS:1 n=1 Tax=Paraglomus brasilianum TaxID=144538 RepID=A0A9N9CQ25_9GLOM|nr:2559_t:CDS:2 [Paraglomus brasilianum]
MAFNSNDAQVAMDIIGAVANCLPFAEKAVILFNEVMKMAKAAKEYKSLWLTMAGKLERLKETLERHNPDSSSPIYQNFVAILEEFQKVLKKNKVEGKLRPWGMVRQKVAARVILTDFESLSTKIDLAMNEFNFDVTLQIHTIVNTTAVGVSNIDAKIQNILDVKNTTTRELETKLKVGNPENFKAARPPVKRGSTGQIVKKIYISQRVAMRDYGSNDLLKDETRSKLLKHIAVVKELGRHPNIISTLGYTIQNGHFYLVSEWCEFDNLRVFLHNRKELDWNVKLKIAMELAGAMVHFHAHEFLHRNLRSDVVLLDGSLTPKLAGFMDSRNVADKSTKLVFEGIRWRAPEKLRIGCSDDESEWWATTSSYTVKADVYSFTMLLWELASHKVPYAEIDDNDSMVICDMILSGKRPSLDDIDIPAKYKDIITRGWNDEVDDRPDMKEIYEVLNRLASGIDPLWEEDYFQFRPQHIPEIKIPGEDNNTSNGNFDSGFDSDSASVTGIKPGSVSRSRASSFGLTICTSTPPSATSSAFPTPTGSVFNLGLESSTEGDAGDRKDTSEDDKVSPKEFLEKGRALHKEGKYQQAFDQFQKVAELGEPLGHYYLGLYLVSVKYGFQDIEASFVHLAKAAEGHVQKAGYLYATHWQKLHQRLDETAVKYLKMSSDAGYREAMVFYGRLLVKKDVAGAEELLNKANLGEGEVSAELEKFGKKLREAIERSKQQPA